MFTALIAVVRDVPLKREITHYVKNKTRRLYQRDNNYFFPPHDEGLLPPHDASFLPPHDEGLLPPHDDALLPHSAKSLSAMILPPNVIYTNYIDNGAFKQERTNLLPAV